MTLSQLVVTGCSFSEEVRRCGVERTVEREVRVRLWVVGLKAVVVTRRSSAVMNCMHMEGVELFIVYFVCILPSVWF